MNRNSVFVRWHYVTEPPDQQVVFPDGSRDILFLTDPDGHTRITGYRLRPGLPVTQTTIDTAMTMHASILNAARARGVSTRTMQRLFTRHNLPSPQYWHLLASDRWASNTLSTAPSLVETATLFGYSEQAHMTRDIVRWFGYQWRKLN